MAKHSELSGTQLHPNRFIGAKAYNSGTQSLTASTADQVITFDSEEYDSDAIHSTVSNTGRFTVPAGKGGKWRFAAGGLMQGTTANLLFYFRKNGTTGLRGGNTVPSGTNRGQVMTEEDLAAADYVEFLVTTAAGTSITIGHASTENAQTWCTATFLG